MMKLPELEGDKRKPHNLSPGALFHESLADGWSARNASRGFKRRVAFVKDQLQGLIRPGALWLDAGCGSGVLARELNLLGARVVAVDGSPKMIECALKETRNASAKAEFVLVNAIDDLDEENSTYDGILCSSVIEYVDKPERTLAEFYRVLSPGGVMLVSVPNRFSPIRLFQRLSHCVSKQAGRAVFPYIDVSRHDFTAAGIRILLERAGFTVERIDVFDPIISEFFCRSALGSLFMATVRKPRPLP